MLNLLQPFNGPKYQKLKDVRLFLKPKEGKKIISPDSDVVILLVYEVVNNVPDW